MDHVKELKHQVAMELASLISMSDIAYIRPVEKDNVTHYALCSADGSQLAVFPTYETAYYTAKQHELEPFSAH